MSDEDGNLLEEVCLTEEEILAARVIEHCYLDNPSRPLCSELGVCRAQLEKVLRWLRERLLRGSAVLVMDLDDALLDLEKAAPLRKVDKVK